MATNVERLQQAYSQWSETKAGSGERFLDLVDDDIDFRSLADGAQRVAFTKGGRGRETVRAYLKGLTDDWEMDFFRVEEFVAQNDTVVVLIDCRWKEKKTGRMVRSPKADIWRFRDGRAVSFFEFYDTAAMVGAIERPG